MLVVGPSGALFVGMRRGGAAMLYKRALEIAPMFFRARMPAFAANVPLLFSMSRALCGRGLRAISARPHTAGIAVMFVCLFGDRCSQVSPSGAFDVQAFVATLPFLARTVVRGMFS